MAEVRANDLELEYESFGPANAPAVVQIMGVGAQLTRWSDRFAVGMAARGYRFIRFDNRDVGLSEKLPRLGRPVVADLIRRLRAGETVAPPYPLADMAADTVGLLAALGLERAHILGESMGGMIAQIVAAGHADRTASLISVMSTSGRPGLPEATPAAREALFRRPEDPDDAEQVIANATRARMVLAGPAFDPGADYQRSEAAAAYRRAYYPDGFARQFAAVLTAGSRVALLGGIDRPSLVVHGRDDPLVRLAAGEDCARLIPGAELKVVDGMGHAVEPALAPILVDIVVAFLDRIERRN